MARRTITTKDISLLHQLYSSGQLDIRPEFQRNSVWPREARAYLIDTILNDRAIPLLFFRRVTSPQSGRQTYEVIDGQQRLRTIFDYLENKFRLSSSTNERYRNLRFNELNTVDREQLLQYDLPIEELAGYSDEAIRDTFVRINKYNVKLSTQEIRHAQATGAFKDRVEAIGKLPFWQEKHIFTKLAIERFRHVEFAAELLILLYEGPQDKKSSVNTFYATFEEQFEPGAQLESRLVDLMSWVFRALPDFGTSRFRRPVDLYALIGAIDEFTSDDRHLKDLNPDLVTAPLKKLEEEIDSFIAAERDGPGQASFSFSHGVARYVVAASRQTDNLRPRQTRIEVFRDVLASIYS